MVSSLGAALNLTDEPRVITKGQSPFVILHTNKAWAELTGYRFAEVANETAFFLQGPDTDKETVGALNEACKQGKHIKVRLINYRRSGEPFMNTIELHPLHDHKGELTHWCAVLHGEPAPKHCKPLSDEARGVLLQQLAKASDDSSTMWLNSRQPPAQDSLTCLDLPSSLLSAHVQQSPFDPLSNLSEGMTTGAQQVSRPHMGRTDAQAPTAAAQHRPKRRRDEKMRLADALNNTKDAIILTQPHPPYKITHVNKPWIVMCRYTQEDVEGQTNALLHGPETDQEILQNLMGSVSRGESASATIYNYKKGGEKFLNQVQVMPVYNEEDDIDQFMALLHEVDV